MRITIFHASTIGACAFSSLLVGFYKVYQMYHSYQSRHKVSHIWMECRVSIIGNGYI